MGELVGYLSSALAFSMLLVLVLMVWRGRFQGIWLIQALVFSIVWSVYLGFSTTFAQFNPTNQTFVEILRAVAWIMLIWRLYARQQGVSESGFWRNYLLWGGLAGVALLLFLNILQSTSARLFQSDNLIFVAPFLLVIIALILLEQWYRSIKRESRWQVKFFALGLAVIFGYDFVLFSEALLYERLDPVLWLARGWVAAIMVPFMAVSIARTHDWEQPVRVSHQAAFYTTGVLLAGVYLLVMAAVGYYLRWFGGGWGSAVQVVFVVLSLSFLGLLLASGTARAMVSVWISKHFFTYKYDYRDEWVRANARFAELPIDGRYYEELVRAVATPVDSMGGWLWVLDDKTLLSKASWSINQELSIENADAASLVDFCNRLGWVIELKQFRSDPGHYPDLVLPDAMIRSDDLWLIVPLLHQGVLFGLVGLRDPRAERSINWEDYDLLKALGGQVAALLALRNASEALSEARQFEAFNRLSAFVVHDLKNIVAQLSLVVTNAERHKHNPEFIDDALDTLSNAVKRMNRLLSQLRQQSQLNVRHEVTDGGRIAADVQNHQKEQRPVLQLENISSDVRLKVERERLVSVLCHLVQNAQEATSIDGTVTMSCLRDGSFAVYTITDNGCGMDEKFIRERLFKPFDTTKGRAGMGIGVYEAQQFVRSCGGRIEVDSRTGEGTVFRVFLPVCQQQDSESEGIK